MGPAEQDAAWADTGIEGAYRFLARLWRLGDELATADHGERGADAPPDPTGDDEILVRKANWAIDKVTRDMVGSFGFNTAIAAVMELYNDCSRLRDRVEPGTLRFALATAASIVFPFAPHTGADVYDRLTGERVWEQPWPAPDPRYLEAASYTLVCQVNGKVRDRVQAPAAASEEELAALCREAPNVQAHVDGRQVVKQVVVPGRLVNLVVR